MWLHLLKKYLAKAMFHAQHDDFSKKTRFGDIFAIFMRGA